VILGGRVHFTKLGKMMSDIQRGRFGAALIVFLDNNYKAIYFFLCLCEEPEGRRGNLLRVDGANVSRKHG
jgi:hypothetical protein